MITFKSVGHFFAKAFQTIASETPKIATALDDAQKVKPVVEGVTVAVGGAAIVPLEDAAFAALGALAAFLHVGGDASAAKLADLGFDTVAIAKAKDVLAASSQLVAVAKAL